MTAGLGGPEENFSYTGMHFQSLRSAWECHPVSVHPLKDRKVPPQGGQEALGYQSPDLSQGSAKASRRRRLWLSLRGQMGAVGVCGWLHSALLSLHITRLSSPASSSASSLPQRSPTERPPLPPRTPRTHTSVLSPPPEMPLYQAPRRQSVGAGPHPSSCAF